MADRLLEIIAETSPETRRKPPAQSPSQASSHNAVARKKRAQVIAACQRCRHMKVKCDALRPCTACAKKALPCHYDTEGGETRSQASKRKYEELAHCLDNYKGVFDMLASQDEHNTGEIIRRIRGGYGPGDILKHFKAGAVFPALPDGQRLSMNAFLISLAHSTGSLRDIIRLASRTLDPSANATLPHHSQFLIFRNSTIRPRDIENLLQQSARIGNFRPASLLETVTISPERKKRLPLDASNTEVITTVDACTPQGDVAPHQVPSAPWTTITSNDEAVSHLVSLFLAWINPAWRFVEEDMFLTGMRSRNLESDFCSPLLVNSICAIASLHSEHEVAFLPGDSDRIARGRHFHNEAVRLWACEEGRPSLTNVQALCVLSLESNYRAEDRIGLSLIQTAVELNDDLPLSDDAGPSLKQGVSKRDMDRVRSSTHWTVNCTHIIMRIAFMSNVIHESRFIELPKIHDVYDDEFEFWIGYPFSKSPIPYRPTLYLRERCKLALLFRDLHRLIAFNRPQLIVREFARAVERVSEKLRRWKERLPIELHYEWPMSVAVWELHASYHATVMILYLEARSRFQRDPTLSETTTTADNEHEIDDTNFRWARAEEKLSEAIPHAHTAAQMLCDFRERYGFKVSPAWLLQLQATTAGVLLLDPELAQTSANPSPDARLSQSIIQDSHTAFDEVFRGLLGTGVEVMIARGIARMMYHTALRQNILLSPSTKSMLQMMSSTAWRPSDLDMLNSGYPNFATIKGHEDRERMTELLSKWEKLEL